MEKDNESENSVVDENKSNEVEDFDFDGDDVDLDKVPSWLEDDPDQEGFTVSESEDLLGETDSKGKESKLPDTSELFGSSSPDSLGEIAALEEQRDAYLGALRQLQADFENYKKRVVRDSLEDAEIKGTKILEDLLPVLDSFDLALKNLESEDEEVKKLRKGVELVFSDLFKVMEKQGLEIIESEGAVFNPEIHDAVSHEDNDEHEVEIVVEVLRPGYKVRGRVVRPAMVKVAK